MSTEQELPDLGETPVIDPQQRYDDETDLLEAAVPPEAMEGEIDAILERAGEFEERLRRGDERKDGKKKAEPPVLDHPVSPREVAKKRAEERMKEKEKEEANLKGKKKKKGAFSMSLALLKERGSTAPPVKPHAEPRDQGKEKEREKGEVRDEKKEEDGKEEKETGEDPDTPEAGSENDEEKTPREGVAAQEFGGAKGRDHEDEMWGDRDEGFPHATPPDLSEDYPALSVASSHVEGLNADLKALMEQVVSLSTMVKEQSDRIATIEKEVKNVKQDKSQFHSHTLGEIRALKRQMGNRPSIAASAEQITSPVQEKQNLPETEKKVLTPEERAKRLAEIRAKAKW